MKKLTGLFLSALLLAGCSGGQESAESGKDKKTESKNEKVTVVLDWTPNTNHTGLYVAEEKGYFKEEGLDVDIILPGEAGAEQLVASGKADFGVSHQETVTEARIQELPVVSIGAIVQHNTSGFASPVEKNIKSPKDFAGKTYGGWGGPAEKPVISTLMNVEKANVDDVSFVNMGETDFFTAVKRDIDFAWIFYAWTGIEAELRGEKLNMIYLTDYSKNLDYYTPLLVANEGKIKDNADQVKKFMNAVSKGYNFTIENPAEAADILIKENPDLDAELVKKSQEWLSPRYKDDAPRWGEQKQEVWENYAKWMFENKVLEKELDVKSAFTNEFLPK
ncbi:ABC transporter substrate-binding protein [Metabacillus fastidiosus]|uniref:ABC transporter substrate-binding protein n=1 Tax=Metabacillus fastidiosus TaxID=1458 RepID=UPI002DBBB73C|nr:ABC transporter substrate-binding protein [Metabacillus fastidiosus]MEC2077292.1 ABC transporter substrate-binding protein [Metabacillus fastidiosus]